MIRFEFQKAVSKKFGIILSTKTKNRRANDSLCGFKILKNKSLLHAEQFNFENQR